MSKWREQFEKETGKKVVDDIADDSFFCDYEKYLETKLTIFETERNQIIEVLEIYADSTNYRTIMNLDFNHQKARTLINKIKGDK